MSHHTTRIGSVALATLLAVGLLLPGSAMAQRVFVDPPSFAQHCNVTDTLWIMLDASLVGVEGASLNVQFDQTVGRLDTILAAPALDTNVFLRYQNYYPDSVTIDAGILIGALSGPGALCGLVITLTDHLGASPVTLVRSILRDADNQDIAHLADPGVLDNPCCCAHHGDVAGDDVFDVNDVVTLIDYTFSNGTAPLIDAGCPHMHRGDVNCDAIPDVFDILRLIDFVFSGGPPLCQPCDCSPYPTHCL
ncbi:MAG: hypothetical protein HZB43_01595 [candidate division Zixibacteria bacterium]|nr:hypothetical protein [candidate division Zixibacteria bacterium]